jgi:hypothetical protein
MKIWGSEENATEAKQVQASSGFLDPARGFRLRARIRDEVSVDMLHEGEMRGRTII